MVRIYKVAIIFFICLFRNVIKAFLTSSLLMDVLTTFGDLSEDVIEFWYRRNIEMLMSLVFMVGGSIITPKFLRIFYLGSADYNVFIKKIFYKGKGFRSRTLEKVSSGGPLAVLHPGKTCYLTHPKLSRVFAVSLDILSGWRRENFYVGDFVQTIANV